MHKIEPLDAKRHQRSSFDCGSVDLNRFIHQLAAKQHERGVSRTYVLVETSNAVPRPILGYYTLTTCQLETATLPENFGRALPRVVAAMLLGKLAVARGYQQYGMGKFMIADTLSRYESTFRLVGGVGLLVDAKDDAARDYYVHQGFVPLGPISMRLFLPRVTIQAMLAAARNH